ncbi:MAG: hypothetical protein J0H29_05135 [Sphingobacteriales bacterium]|nr:hypothetical protein [Sphingobacteriales bacterium]OJY86192.1 MAG: hypothetical protein BGP14_17105 [Sphingobacteriales bacterium 44-15]
MENLSIVSDFQVTVSPVFYKKIAELASGDYCLFTGGNFFFITGPGNKAVRFTWKGTEGSEITEKKLAEWLALIRIKFPLF